MIALALVCLVGMATDGPAFTAANEGRRHNEYVDTRGNRTIGIGHRCLPGDPSTMTDNEIAAAFDADYRAAAYGAWAVLRNAGVETKGMPTPVAVVCIDMVFNLGVAGFAGFHRFIAALKRRDYFAAVGELRDSEYERQLPHRVDALCGVLLRVARHSVEKN